MEEETEKGFYKMDGAKLIFAPNFVYSKDYELVIENKDKYVLPIDGWNYFESPEEAMASFNVKIKEESVDKKVIRKEVKYTIETESLSIKGQK